MNMIGILRKYISARVLYLAILGLLTACGDNGSTSPGPPVATIVVSLPETMIEIGETVQASAELRDAAGQLLTGRVVTWSTSNTSVATVTGSGLVTPLSAGEVLIRASSEGKNASISLSIFVAATQPTLSITSGGQPVDLQNVKGTIEFALDAADGTLPIVSTELLIDGQVVAVTPAVPAPRGQSSSPEGTLETQGVVIVLSVNTADFHPGTGVPKLSNGPRVLSARQNLAGNKQRTWNFPAIVLNNPTVFTGRVTPQFTYPSATTPGLIYRGGDMSFVLTPIIYSPGITMTSGTLAFGPKPDAPRPVNATITATASVSGNTTAGPLPFSFSVNALQPINQLLEHSFAVEQYTLTGSTPVDPQAQSSALDVNRDGFVDSPPPVVLPAGTFDGALPFRYLEPLRITDPALPSCKVGQGYSYTITAGGGTGSNSISIDGNLPPGIIFSASTRTITGSATAAGASQFDIVVSDNDATGLTHRRSSVLNCLPNAVPVASFVSSCAASSCNFDASASSDPDGDQLLYSWNFGDGTSAEGKVVQHAFAASGTYFVTLTVDDGVGVPQTVTHQVTVGQTGGIVSDIIYAANTASGIGAWVRLPDGSLSSLGFATGAGHIGASEFHTLADPASPATSIFATYITSREIVKWDFLASGLLSEVAAFVFGEAPFQVGINATRTCLAVPLQTTSRIQNLTSNLTATSQLTIAGSFPTKVLFNPKVSVAYAVDGPKIHVLNSNPETCALSETGTAPSFANRRDVALDRLGDFLHVLTFNPFGSVSTLALQPLVGGQPGGAPVVTPLPAGSFLVVPHPTLDVLYVIQDIPREIRKVSFNRATGVATVGASVSAAGADELAFSNSADRLYYTNVNSPSTARICWFELNPQGDLLGTPTCDANPARGIDSDLIVVPPPAPNGGVRAQGEGRR